MTRLLLLTALWLFATGAGAADVELPPIPSEVTIHLVLDGSGSMRSQDPAGPRIDILRSGVASFARKHSRPAIGLRTFGDSPQLVGCADTTLVLTPDHRTPDEISDVLRELRPEGSSPISAALRRAVRDLEGRIGTQVVVMVADGGDTCSQDPLVDVANVMGEVPGVRIEVIGLNVRNDADREQLQGIANAGGGRYFAASNASQLTYTLGKIASDAYQREDERVARLQEEARLRAELVAKTRLRVLFNGNFPDFFCDGLFVQPLRINGKRVQLADDGRVPCAGSTVLLDEPRPPGNYVVEVGYAKALKGDRSRGDNLTIEAVVESGQTTTIELDARMTFFAWTLEGAVTME
jgi:hypothetical protein